MKRTEALKPALCISSDNSGPGYFVDVTFKIASFYLKFVPIPCVSIGLFQYFMLHVYWPFQKFCAMIYKEKV